MCDFNRYWDNVAGICRGKFIYITNNILQTMCVKHGGQSVIQLHVEKNNFFLFDTTPMFQEKENISSCLLHQYRKIYFGCSAFYTFFAKHFQCQFML